ncbi:hypothetical protein GYMLUDRAFT_48026 [Collybiopsis luxurians FD-317 M1]|uniref:Uncharacterized protein n=1 Tax=Collybiopsis luxurians FD-317 M1 TaxID=944289 RepID=A0A0D0CAN2_9AGAR|nr:hypothetical protein GYMLUDRAFT_48026 [Collybiopsis luxurians FD-317 M1]
MSASSGPPGFLHHDYTADFGPNGNTSKAGSSYGEEHRNRAESQIAEGQMSESLAPVVPYSHNEGPSIHRKTKLALTTNNDTQEEIASLPTGECKLTKGNMQQDQIEQLGESIQGERERSPRVSEVLGICLFILFSSMMIENLLSEGLETQKLE